MNEDMIFPGLVGKRAIVTGAIGGIGSVIAVLLGKSGAFVGVHYNDRKYEAERIAADIISNGGKAVILKADLFNMQSGIYMVDEYVDRFGGIDILVNNAGGTIGANHFLDLDEDAWDKTFFLNVKAPFFLIKQVAPIMMAQNNGKIINISSISAKYGGGNTSLHYGAAKAALDTLTKGLSRSLAQYNVLVNSVRAGFVDTDQHRKMGRTEADIKERLKLVPLKRAAQPIEIAQMVLFLLSTAGDYTTGEVFTVAGGD